LATGEAFGEAAADGLLAGLATALAAALGLGTDAATVGLTALTVGPGVGDAGAGTAGVHAVISTASPTTNQIPVDLIARQSTGPWRVSDELTRALDDTVTVELFVSIAAILLRFH
jgi:hypothetical protein